MRSNSRDPATHIYPEFLQKKSLRVAGMRVSFFGAKVYDAREDRAKRLVVLSQVEQLFRSAAIFVVTALRALGDVPSRR